VTFGNVTFIVDGVIVGRAILDVVTVYHFSIWIYYPHATVQVEKLNN